MVNCYPVAGKAKSMAVCSAFAHGCGGKVFTDGRSRPGESMFYGVDASNDNAWRGALAQAAEDADTTGYYYADNSYFDAARGHHFRVTRNAMQHSGVGTSDGARFRALGVEIKPWRKDGTHFVVCPQSEPFMRLVGYQGDWTADTLRALAAIPDRKIVLRQWSADKGALAATLGDDLVDARALITHSSAAAVTAVLAGVPAICTARCACTPMSSGLDCLASPRTPSGRQAWASVLADNEWTLDEMRVGAAWAVLRG